VRRQREENIYSSYPILCYVNSGLLPRFYQYLSRRHVVGFELKRKTKEAGKTEHVE